MGKIGIDVQHAAGFFLSLLSGFMSRMALLPQEFGSAQEEASTHFPAHDIGPLVEQNGQIAITLYPLRVHVANYGLRCGTDDKGLRQSGTSCQMAVLTLLQGGVGYHSTFHGKAFHMLGLFLQEANRN